MLLTKRNGIVAALVLPPLLIAGSLMLRTAAGQRAAARTRQGVSPDPEIQPGTPDGSRKSRWSGVIIYDATVDDKFEERTGSSSGTHIVTGKSWARYEVSGETKNGWDKDLITLRGTATGETHKNTAYDGTDITNCHDQKSRSTEDGKGSGPVTVTLNTYVWTDTQYHYEIDLSGFDVPVAYRSKSWSPQCPKPGDADFTNSYVVRIADTPSEADCPPPFSNKVDPDHGGNTCLACEARYHDRTVSGSKTWTSTGGVTHHVTWDFLVMPPKPTR
ncbi:MAG: hypothetical protein M3Y50_00665 [Acidobacteriota bacterium]|nr:hypothetical protein [Acidobacteriota bacterium]